MSESRLHRRRVLALVRHMQARGVEVLAADAPGWRRPPPIGGRRPDVFGFYPVLGVAVAGEVKRGPEAWASFPQLYQITAGLAALCPRGASGLLVLAAAAPEWEDDLELLRQVLGECRTAIAMWPCAA